ncbi:MAG: fatty acid CoA ligase family protein [Myxococcota bacterium]|nr:fatty acid CoA ligase family protein [Myxococcota bacterium]
MAAPEMNFAALFQEQARLAPYRRALIIPGPIDPESGQRAWTHRRFGQLAEQVDACAWGLREQVGLSPGERVMMLVPAGFPFFEIALALWKLGCVPVLIDPGMGLEGFLSCIEQVKPTALVAIEKGMLLSKVKGRAFASVTKRVTVGKGTWFWGGHLHQRLHMPERGAMSPHPVEVDTLAAILFTSGSTGPAKGVEYTHGMFQTQASRIAAMYGIQAGQVEVSCFLPFSMFSMSMGVSCVLPDMDFAAPASAEPDKIFEAVEEQGASQLVASPAVLKKMARTLPERGLRLPSLDRVLTFGAPIPRTLHQDFKRILREGAEVHTPYGATESLPVATIASDEILEETGGRAAQGEGTCVGSVDPSVTVAIIPITDAAIEAWREEERLGAGQIGEICVKGPQVSAAYFQREDANQVAKIPDPDGGGFWHRMGDVGYLDGRGRLWFCGRKGHRVGTEDPLFPVRLEGVYNEHPRVIRSAVVESDGVPTLILEVDGAITVPERLASEVLALGQGNTECERIRKVLFHPGFPVDRRHNAKIHRPELAGWAEGRKGVEV